jgi:serine/threonine protein kinase/outer membrane protein assembly factor BamB
LHDTPRSGIVAERMMVSESDRCPRCGRPSSTSAEDCPACRMGQPPASPTAPEPSRTDSLPRLAGLQSPLRVGATFRGFEIGHAIGSGGTAVVHKARQISLERTVAIKVLANEFLSSPRFVERFEREARVLASLNHPNLVHLYEFGQEGDLLFLAMEYVDGVTLQEWLKTRDRGRIPRFLDLMAGVCEGLGQIHRAGLVHRDLKPSNILIPHEGPPKISDFGLAVDVSDAAHSTAAGSVLGTPSYMSPEQILGRAVDARSDLYSLGVILFESLAGRLPFEGTTTAVLVRQAHELPRSLGDLVPDLPQRMQRLTAALLSKDPEARPASAAEVRETVLAAVRDLESFRRTSVHASAPEPRASAPVPAPISKSRASGKRPPLRRIALGILLLIAMAGGGLWLSGRLGACSLIPGIPRVESRPSTAGPSRVEGHGLRYEYYEGPWSALPFFDRLAATSKGVLPNFVAPPEHRRGNCGLRLRGWIEIPKEGTYAFMIKGSVEATLAVHGKSVLTANGMVQGVKGPGLVMLPRGPVFLAGEFLIDTAPTSVEAYWQGPGLELQIIPSSALLLDRPDPTPPLSALPLRDPEAGPTAELRPGMAFAYFEGHWTTLPDFSTAVPVLTGTSSDFDLHARLRHVDYAFRFRGLLQVPKDGDYTFTLLSDDGSKLFIGDREVVSNDGAHSVLEESGRIGLKAGLHPLTVAYFQAAGGEELEVSWKGPGFARKPIPAEILFHRPAGTEPGRAPAAAPAAEDWPQWRGANRDNVSTVTGLLGEWPEGGPPLAWKAGGLGTAMGTVAVAAGRVYLLGDVNYDTALIALDAADGSLLWRRKIGGTGNPEGYLGARSTPATDGAGVYALSADGTLSAVDSANGNVIWSRTLTSLGGTRPHWGYAESPLLAGDLLLCTPGGPKGSVAALDKRTGDLVWQSLEWKDLAHYSSLVPAEFGGVRQVVALTGGGVAGIDVRTGRVLWEADIPAKVAMAATPVVRGDRVFVISAHKFGCRCFRIRGDASGFRTEELYAHDRMDSQHGGVVAVGGFVYGLDEDGLKCLDLETGKIVWQAPSVGKGSLLAADGRLICRGELPTAGLVALVDASPDGYRERGRFNQPDLSGKVLYEHPVVAGRRLYLRDQDLLLCYDLRDSR